MFEMKNFTTVHLELVDDMPSINLGIDKQYF